MRRSLAVLLLVAFAPACSDEAPTTPTLSPPLAESPLDWADAGSIGLHFLPPLASPVSTGGEFIGTAAPVVDICRLSEGSCVADLASFTTGDGADQIDVNASAGRYSLNWHTRDAGLEDGVEYRISVTVGTLDLGSLDIRAVANGKGLKAAAEDGFFGLVIGRLLPIRFRIETAAMTDARLDAAMVEGFERWWASTNRGMGLMVSTGSDAHSASWGNWGMRDFSSEPRQAWNNSPSYAYGRYLLDFWNDNYVAASRAWDVITAIGRGFELPGPGETERAAAAAHLLLGLAHGNLALWVDQAFILDPRLDLGTDDIELRPYGEVMDAALGYLDDAAGIASGASFTLPGTWIHGEALTSSELGALARSYQARYLASVARTPAERQAVDWSAVQAAAAQGLTRDFAPTAQWTAPGGWFSYDKVYGHLTIWSRADLRLIGGVRPNDPETDPNGDYAAWLATPVALRLPYDVTTDDRRVTGATPTEDGSYVQYAGPSVFPAARGTYHFSNYTLFRGPLPDFDGAPMPTIGPAEMRLLEAEARYRMSMGGVASILNDTRVGNGQLSPASDADPQLFDVLAYEKRMESWFYAPELNWFDRRGFGPPLAPTGFGHGLVEGTPNQFPVPGAELARLGLPNYTFGGTGGALTAAALTAPGGGAVPASRIHRPRVDVRPAERGSDPVTHRD